MEVSSFLQAKEYLQLMYPSASGQRNENGVKGGCVAVEKFKRLYMLT